MALEPIFASDDIKRQLEEESESFAGIDSNFRMRMQQVESNKQRSHVFFFPFLFFSFKITFENRGALSTMQMHVAFLAHGSSCLDVFARAQPMFSIGRFSLMKHDISRAAHAISM